MALERYERELFPSDDVTGEKILSDLLNPKGILMKTRIFSPLEVALLKALSKQLKKGILFKKPKKGLVGDFMDDFIEYMLEALVSLRGMSREEVISALATIREDKTARSITERLLGMGNKPQQP